MIARHFLSFITAPLIAILFVILMNRTEAQINAQVESHEMSSGLITRWLSPKQLERWDSIIRLATAKDESHNPMHPVLYDLLQWAETSGHTIYIEVFVKEVNSASVAGNFSMVRLDPQSKNHTAVIQIFLSNIDRAYVGPENMRKDGIILMDNLSRTERYAEVLGHELAHARHILSNPVLSHKVMDLVEETNVLLRSHYIARGRADNLGSEMRRRLDHRDTLLAELEETAEAVEVDVWYELVNSQPIRGNKYK